MDKGNIIFINGASSSGKTSLARELQNVLDEPYLHVGLDHFLPMLPGRFSGINPSVQDPAYKGVHCILPFSEGIVKEIISLRSEEKLSFHQIFNRLGLVSQLNEKGMMIKFGSVAQRLISGMHRAISALALSGNNVIIDHAFVERVWLEECVGILHDYRVWFVGIRCPLEVLEQRERDRGDRIIGEAKWSFDLVHAHGKYDLEIDPSVVTLKECALLIKDHLQSGPPPEAFNWLRQNWLK